jgi:hypothetical protein
MTYTRATVDLYAKIIRDKCPDAAVYSWIDDGLGLVVVFRGNRWLLFRPAAPELDREAIECSSDELERFIALWRGEALMNGYVIIQTQSDMQWYVDGDRHGWLLPPSAGRFWRSWPMRWFRGVVLTWNVVRHEEFFRQLGLISSGFDRWVLYAIWRGWC